MAEHGARIFNYNGYRVIDSNYSNLGLFSKGTVFCGTQIAATGDLRWFEGRLDLSPSGTGTPVMAMECDYPAVLRYVINNGSYWSFYFAVGVPLSNTTGASLSYYAFGKNPSGLGPWGVRIKNAQGLPVFDSNRPYLNVVGVVPGTVTAGGPPLPFLNIGDVWQRSFSSRGRIAFVQSAYCVELNTYESEDTPPWTAYQDWHHVGCKKIGPNTIEIQKHFVGTQSVDGVSTNPFANMFQDCFNYLLVDVTNF
jgi:hypothetical protein